MITPKKNLHKGHYGHLKRYKHIQLFLLMVCFLFILLDVLFSLIVFQTRKTLFIVMAAVLSIPFSRNFVSYLLALKCEPLSEKEYKEAEAIAGKYEGSFVYDIAVTGDTVYFFPCAAIYGNNLIAYLPQASDAKKQSEAKDYLDNINTELKDKVRIVVVDSFQKLDKELSRISKSVETNEARESEIRARLLQMGF